MTGTAGNVRISSEFTEAHDDFIGSPKTSGFTFQLTSGANLSQEFVERLLRFVAWAPGWDGAEADHIPVSVAVKAFSLARRSLAFAGEPFVAPADGSILLRWHLPHDRVAELFVDEEETLEAIALVSDDEVWELPVQTDEDVISRLREIFVKA